MKRVLGRKQKIRNEDWLNVMQHIEDFVSPRELTVERCVTIEDIRSMIVGKKAAYAWSAGKDSIVLGEICSMVGITDCMMAVCNLEYPVFMQWVEKHRPEGLKILNTGQNLEWLSEHPSMLFPQDSATAAKWFSIVQHRAQAQYYKENDLDVLLLGRRRADGNYCGKGSNSYTDKKGVTRYSPLASWSHEEILAYIHYHKLPLPPIYKWKNGYLCGTHPWAARQWTGFVENGWREVFDIDENIVKRAAECIESAAKFLDKVSIN